jgi:glycosyltransferase involved in cell wall biosynthesis
MPELYRSKGGIQTYSGHFLRAIAHRPLPLPSPLQPPPLQVFLKHDAAPWPSPDVGPESNAASIQHYGMGQIPLPLRTPAFAAQLITQGLWQRPDLVITTHINFTQAAWQLKQWGRIPYWTVAHGIEAWNITNPRLQRGLRHADRILAVSHYTRDRLLQEQSLDPDKIVVLPNTVDATQFAIGPKPTHLLQRHHLRPDQPIILTVCRLAEVERYKGYDQILAALPAIRRVLPTVQYVIVGQGSDRPRLEALIAQQQLQDCVTLAGFVPDAELGDYYNLCDVFAMPSKREGFGIVYLEAMACGKPVLGGNQDGALDALCQGKLGALVNPDDPQEIAQTLIQILTGQYPNPLMYQPIALRQAVMDIFGLGAFQSCLYGYLRDYFHHDDQWR